MNGSIVVGEDLCMSFGCQAMVLPARSKCVCKSVHFMSNSYAQISDDQSSSRDDTRKDVCSHSIISQLNSCDVPLQTPETDDAPSNEAVPDHPAQNRNAGTIYALPFLHVRGNSQGKRILRRCEVSLRLYSFSSLVQGAFVSREAGAQERTSYQVSLTPNSPHHPRY